MSSTPRKVPAGPGLRATLARAATGGAGIRLAGMGFTFLVGLQLARMLGANGYGHYGLAMSLIALLSIPTQFGLPQLVIREIAAARVKNAWGLMRGILRWSVKINLVLSCIVATAVYGLVRSRLVDIDPILAGCLLAGLILIPLTGQTRIREATFLGLQQFALGQMPTTLLRPALYSLLLLGGAMSADSFTPALAIWLLVMAAGVTLLTSELMLRKVQPVEINRASPQSDPERWRAAALPLALTEGMRVIQGHTSVLVLGALASTAAVGLFRVASSISLVLSAPVTLFNVVGAPMISKLHAENNPRQLQKLCTLLCVAMTASTAALCLPFFFAGEEILSLVFGREFGASNPPLLVLCGGAILSAALGPNAILLNMTGHEKRVTRASAISMLTLVIIAPVLVLFFDIMGAAVANVLANLVWQLLMGLDVFRKLGINGTLLPLASNRVSGEDQD